MTLNHSQKVFFELVKAGLWEKEALLSQFGNIDFAEVYRLAVEQSVLGLLLAGLEHSDVRPPQDLLLQWIGEVQIIEQQNKAMNAFVAKLINDLRKRNIYAILVKGQGIAQCYERPLWRACGDIDLLLNGDDYEKAKEELVPLASEVEVEYKHFKHIGMTIEGWVVELHGTLHSRISNRVDSGIDDAQRDLFYARKLRSWDNGGTQVLLPAPNHDAVFVFAHIYKHFFGEGIGLRQICDWCRLLWTYKDEIDKPLLESRLKRMHLMDKWRAFAALAVDYLEMPVDSMPFYSPSKKWKIKADSTIALILESGNLGHAVDKSYKYKYPTIIRAFVAASHHTAVAFRHFLIFPYDSFLGWTKLMYIGIRANMKR